MSCKNKVHQAHLVANQSGVVPVTGGEVSYTPMIRRMLEEGFRDKSGNEMASALQETFRRPEATAIAALDVMIQTGKKSEALRDLVLAANDPDLAYHLAVDVDRSLNDPQVYTVLKQNGEALLAAVMAMNYPLNDQIRYDICQGGQALALGLYEGYHPISYQYAVNSPWFEYYCRHVRNIPSAVYQSAESVTPGIDKNLPYWHEIELHYRREKKIAEVLCRNWSEDFYIQRYNHGATIDFVYKKGDPDLIKKMAEKYPACGIAPHYYTQVTGVNLEPPRHKEHLEYMAWVIEEDRRHRKHIKSHEERLMKDPSEWGKKPNLYGCPVNRLGFRRVSISRFGWLWNCSVLAIIGLGRAGIEPQC